MSMEIWQPRATQAEETLHWCVGPLDLWVKQTTEEWLVAFSHGEENRGVAVDTKAPPDDIDWRRWAANFSTPRVKLSPWLPDRSVIVRPASPLQILPGHEARFFVGVPLWVQLSVLSGARKSAPICEVNVLQLSNSWFGTPTEGELCYALRTRAKRTLPELTPVPHRAVCSLLLRNDSENTLDFQRLCLRTRDLNVFEGNQHLWTNDGKVVFKGEESLSEVTYGKGPPPFDGASALLTAARDKPERSLLAKTFDNLKAFASF